MIPFNPWHHNARSKKNTFLILDLGWNLYLLAIRLRAVDYLLTPALPDDYQLALMPNPKVVCQDVICAPASCKVATNSPQFLPLFNALDTLGSPTEKLRTVKSRL